MIIDDKPNPFVNNGRELRIVAAVEALTLEGSPDIALAQGLTRSRSWRVTGISKCDLATVAAVVHAIVPSAVVYPDAGEIEWQNL